MERIVKGEEEMSVFAIEVLRTLQQNTTHATVLGLTGDLGSGKTTFTQLFAKALSIEAHVVSPTYVIAKFYDMTNHATWKRLVHIDAYRINSPEEMRALKWGEIIADPQNIVIVEWPERIGDLFPKDAFMLKFHFIDQTTRSVTL